MNTQTTTATRTSNATKSRRVTNRSSKASSSRRAADRRTATEPQHVSEVIPEAVEEIKQKAESRKEAAKQRRAELKALSNQLKQGVQAGMIPESEDGTINGLLRFFYAQQGHTELKTFDEWKEAGYIVRKGQKAILLWGKPRKHNAGKENAEAGEDTDQQTTDQQDDFFPVCYVFSNLQVHAINKPADAQA
ncbi:hypothetical protein C7Y71_009810 [Pseudoprevotella muciniphila]|uniref:DUF1738 domain-containing protein n=1 Tax=Pseudoprevotella muciniphila TaxID=2133944 RepID=A0A5P8E8R9_9BACT|nr:ArdC-like ssDNA-binding domain-containing protein [Pseudoprevotella muciniphila]QFQ13277.1 hypothetical protein C7Y71_009810 [Pseudoprevotella muciniphila]